MGPGPNRSVSLALVFRPANDHGYNLVMAGWNDVIPAAQPSLVNGVLSAVAGDTWQWIFVISDNSGTPVPFTTDSVTGTAKIYGSPVNGVEVFPGTVTVATANDGSVVINAAATATASVIPGVYSLSVRLSDGTKTVNLCSAKDTILQVAGY